MKRLLVILALTLAQPAWAIDFVQVGSIDICHDVAVLDADATDGSGKTGIAYNAASLACKYKRSDQTTAAITTITLADGTVGTHADSTWKEIANGLYQICLPDAAYASGRYVDLWCYGAADMAPMFLRVVLTDAAPDVNVISASDTAEYTSVPTTGSEDLLTMMRVVYQLMVNKFDSTATEQTWYRSDGTTVWSTKDISDNGTTYTRTAQETND